MKNPWIKWFPSDWRADIAVRSCSLAARGLWIELLGLMHDADPYGHLLVGQASPTVATLAMLVGRPEQEARRAGSLQPAKRANLSKSPPGSGKVLREDLAVPGSG